MATNSHLEAQASRQKDSMVLEHDAQGNSANLQSLSFSRLIQRAPRLTWSAVGGPVGLLPEVSSNQYAMTLFLNATYSLLLFFFIKMHIFEKK